jgi:hypothetical protein
LGEQLKFHQAFQVADLLDVLKQEGMQSVRGYDGVVSELTFFFPIKKWMIGPAGVNNPNGALSRTIG